MTWRVILAVALLAVGAAPGCGSDEEPVQTGLIWQDEFDGPAGQLPDPAKWTFDVGTGPGGDGWGNNQLEYDTDLASNVSLDGQGNLAITARAQDYEDREYTSGRIKTQGLFARERGRFEARIKLPVGQGIWPAFWMLGDDIGSVGWPTCGEIDIMEYRGQEPNVLHGTLHGPGYSGTNPLTKRYTAEGGLNGAFHVYAVEWTSTSVKWYIDGQLYSTYGPGDLPPGTAWVFDHPFFMLLNVAVGGNWVGSPDESTVFPQTMLVDYVRVYGL
jgi:beta-glucanase (GH16 family)